MTEDSGKETTTDGQELDRLANDILQHSFISAVRKVNCLYPEKSEPGRAAKVSDEALRLSQNISTGFSGTALHSLQGTSGKHDHRLYVNFLGLLGSNGPLPYHYTEYADKRARHFQDPTFREFLDLFNHRMLGLFYRADADFDPSINLDRPESNNFDLFIGALAGLSQTGSKDRDRISYYTKLHYSNWMGCKSKSPDGIKSIVGGYFGLDVEVDEFVGAWLLLPLDARCRLGVETGNMELGKNIYLGKRVWSSRHKFRIKLGPLSLQDYCSFKPGGERAKDLYDLVRNYVGDEWDWELELKLAKHMVQPMRLDRSTVLGFTSWLSGEAVRHVPEKSTILGRDMISTRIH